MKPKHSKKKNNGPELPFKIKKALEVEGGGVGKTKKTLISTRKENRKEARLAKKAKRLEFHLRKSAPAEEKQHFGKKTSTGKVNAPKPAGKSGGKSANKSESLKVKESKALKSSPEEVRETEKSRGNLQKSKREKVRRPKTLFESLLPENLKSRGVQEIEDEDALQRKLYKQLKGRVKGPEDNLGSIVTDLTKGVVKPKLGNRSNGQDGSDSEDSLAAFDPDLHDNSDEDSELDDDDDMEGDEDMFGEDDEMYSGDDDENDDDLSEDRRKFAEGEGEFSDGLDGDDSEMGDFADDADDMSDEDDEGPDDDDDDDGDDDNDDDGDEDDDGEMMAALHTRDAVNSKNTKLSRGEISDPKKSKMSNQGKAGELEKSVSKYVPPALRAKAKQKDDEIDERLVRSVRGLMNRLGESNLSSIVTEVCQLAQQWNRRQVLERMSCELLVTCAEGPRLSERNAAIFAVFVAGVAAGMGAEVGASMSASLATRLVVEVETEKAQSSSNIVQVLCRLCSVGLLPCAVVYGMLNQFQQQLKEINVSLTLTALRIVGPKLRKDDPVGMKRFVETLQECVAAARSVEEEDQSNGSDRTKRVSLADQISKHQEEKKAGKSSVANKTSMKTNPEDNEGGEDASQGRISVRARLLLELVIDLKNNKSKTTCTPEPPGLLKWLSSVGVGEAAVGLAGLTWERLTRQNKVGTWWLPGPTADERLLGQGVLGATGQSQAIGGPLGRQLGAQSASSRLGGGELMRLASEQRMNTDTRRSVFCCIMGAEDYLDAYEKLIRLPLPDEQDRQVIRVLLECCMNESTFNPYYSHLAGRLCQHSHNHKFTLQYALWDYFKQLKDMEVRRLVNLARFLSSAISSFYISLAVLKVVDFGQLGKRSAFFYKTFFEHLLMSTSEEKLASVFSRLASVSKLASTRDGILFFIGTYLAGADNGASPKFNQRFDLVKNTIKRETIL